MDTPTLSPTDSVVDSMDINSLSETQSSSLELTAGGESNPWKDQPVVPSQPIKPVELHAPDLSIIDKFIHVPPEHAPSPAPTPDRDAHTEEVLNEFDPLADQSEQVAREAWALSESHPPPPRPIPVPQPDTPILESESPEPPPKDIPILQTQPPSDSSGASGSSFPSLAALARTFSIPTMARPRPVSIDVAKAVPSPATLSSIAAQQDQRPHDPENSCAVTRSSTPGGSGTESPRPGHRDKEPLFDFQKFLDQMKLKGAEPVAKFLRSYVFAYFLICAPS
jgi:Rab5 GDP/GTP exchange factor